MNDIKQSDRNTKLIRYFFQLFFLEAVIFKWNLGLKHKNQGVFWRFL